MEIRRHHLPRQNRSRRDGALERLEAIQVVVSRREAADQRLEPKVAARDRAFRAEVVAEHARIKEAALQRLPEVEPVVEEVLAVNEQLERWWRGSSGGGVLERRDGRRSVGVVCGECAVRGGRVRWSHLCAPTGSAQASGWRRGLKATDSGPLLGARAAPPGTAMLSGTWPADEEDRCGQTRSAAVPYCSSVRLGRFSRQTSVPPAPSTTPRKSFSALRSAALEAVSRPTPMK